MLAGVGALATAAAVFLAGVYVDQTYPEYIPVVQLGARSQRDFDQTTLDQTLRLIEAHYYDAKVDRRKLSAGSVRGLVQALNDPHSEYLDPDQAKRQDDFYAGRYTGMIGISVIVRDGYPVIASVLPGSPALRAGLQTDDVIVRINGVDAHDMKSEQTSALIRGPAGTNVTLRVRRPGVELDVTVARADFRSPTVQSARLRPDVLYLRVYQFGEATQQEFDDALAAGLPGARAVLLDLRDNRGGFIHAAVSVVSRFVESGVAFEQRSRDGQTDQARVDGNHPASGLPVAVLVNENTASASEIVAGALQAHSRARLVGAKTYGKGSVQVDYRLTDGGDLHLTVAQWYLPDGRSIEKQGLLPDVPVSLASKESMFDVVQPARGWERDAQLSRAVELVAGG